MAGDGRRLQPTTRKLQPADVNDTPYMYEATSMLSRAATLFLGMVQIVGFCYNRRRFCYNWRSFLLHQFKGIDWCRLSCNPVQRASMAKGPWRIGAATMELRRLELQPVNGGSCNLLAADLQPELTSGRRIFDEQRRGGVARRCGASGRPPLPSPEQHTGRRSRATQRRGGISLCT